MEMTDVEKAHCEDLEQTLKGLKFALSELHAHDTSAPACWHNSSFVALRQAMDLLLGRAVDQVESTLMVLKL